MSCMTESRRDQEEGGEMDSQLDTSAGPGEIERREMVLDSQVIPEEIKSREALLSLKVGLLLPQVFLNSGATDIVFVTVLHETAITPFRPQIRPLSFILLSHSDYKVLQILKSGRRGNVLALTSCVLRSDRTESVWMPTDLVKYSGSFNPFTEKEAPAPG